MSETKTTKITWTGPAARIPDLGIEAQPGDTIEIPAGLALAGEGTNWKPATTKKATTPDTPEEQ